MLFVGGKSGAPVGYEPTGATVYGGDTLILLSSRPKAISNSNKRLVDSMDQCCLVNTFPTLLVCPERASSQVITVRYWATASAIHASRSVSSNFTFV